MVSALFAYMCVERYERIVWRGNDLQVSFCKRAIIYRALLRKISYEDKASYGSSPPCMILSYGVAIEDA